MKRLLIILSISLTSCATQRESTNNTSLKINQTDSICIEINKDVKPIHVKESSVSIQIPITAIEDLPIGAGYYKKEGNAGLSVIKSEAGVEIVSSCDSLLILLEITQEREFRLRTLNSELENKLSSVKEVKIREPTSGQWFMIYMGRLFLAYLMYRIIKFKLWKR